ncbi:MAG: adenosine deaminase [Paenibacillaceae bacterium]|jgi:adenosine deaminase|nr:adenosine deaminase [Paenibacillaceae bacterium]
METDKRFDWLSLLPMVDLHVHLDGSVQPQTLRELAQEQGRPLSGESDGRLLRLMQIDEGCSSLVEYLGKFDFVLPYLQTARALERVAYETVEQSARLNGHYLEVRFAPMLHTRAGLKPDEVIGHVLAGLRRGERELGVAARGIAICMRHHPEADNLQVVDAAADYRKHGLVAVDLAGDEAHYPPHLHEEVFRQAGRYGLPVTIHAGEAAGAENIATAVNRLGATRIGHGVRARENPDVLKLVRDQGIPLELCPVSNIQTKAVSAWEDYPVREYFDHGLLLTINTDNPTVSGTSLHREYSVLAERFGFGKEEVARLIMNGVQAAFLEKEAKQKLTGQFRTRFRELGIHVS